MNKTKIEWVKNPDGTPGYSWNPITGCLNGCPYCYARKLANTRLKERYLYNPWVAIPKRLEDKDLHSEDVQEQHQDPFYPRFWPEKLTQPFKRKKPAGIFTCDMSDLFGIGVPEEWTSKVLHRIRECPQHRFYLLTKQPQNLAKFSTFPDNCYVGVSATDAGQHYRAYHYLKGVESSVKYLSYEPLLSGISPGASALTEAGINWVIIGAQTKPTVMPKIEWVREIVEACDKAGVAVFLKNSLKPLFGEGPCNAHTLYHRYVETDNFIEGGYWGLRQEMPNNQGSGGIA